VRSQAGERPVAFVSFRIVTSAAAFEVAVAGPFEAPVRVGGEEIRGSLAGFSLDLLRGINLRVTGKLSHAKPPPRSSTSKANRRR
jgi:hypothetical protein